jgi:superfamily I DNA/RNA helicase
MLRKDIRPVAHKPGKEKIHLFSADNEYKEATFIAGEIEKLVGGFHNLIGDNTHQDGQYGFSDMAVLFRTRAVGKALLTSFKQSGIPVRFGDASSFLETYPFHLITDVNKTVSLSERYDCLRQYTQAWFQHEQRRETGISFIASGRSAFCFYFRK